MTSKLQMHLCGDLILRDTCVPVNCPPGGGGAVANGDWGGLSAIMDEMVHMMDEQRGVGLAAPQVGDRRRFLVMVDPDLKKTYRMINPCITEKSEKQKVMEEGCLSVVDKNNTPVFADVTRPESITVQWLDTDGKSHVEKMTGYAARIAQHEIDHLDGVLFIDYLSPVKREQVMRKVKKRK